MTGPILDRVALAELRDLNRGSLVSRAKLERLTDAAGPGPGGGANTRAKTWATVAGGDALPCRLAPASAGNPSSVADQTVDLARARLVLDVEGPAVLEGDRLTVTGVDAAGNAWTRVVAVLGAESPRSFSAMRVFVCENAPPGQR